MEFDQEVGAGGSIGGDLGQESVQYQGGQPPAFLRQVINRLPGPAGPHSYQVSIPATKPQVDTALRAGEAPTVFAEALEQRTYQLGGGAAAFVTQPLIQKAQGSGQPPFGIRLLQCHHIHELTIGRQHMVQRRREWSTTLWR